MSRIIPSMRAAAEIIGSIQRQTATLTEEELLAAIDGQSTPAGQTYAITSSARSDPARASRSLPR